LLSSSVFAKGTKLLPSTKILEINEDSFDELELLSSDEQLEIIKNKTGISVAIFFICKE
jgi:hypothetical protein